MRLYGYPGASSEENHNRLYLSPDLSQYVEVPTGALLHRMTVPADQDPNGAVVLWVRRDAALIYKSAPAAQALANYFAGAIAGAAEAGVAAAAQRPLTYVRPCYPTEICTPACPYTRLPYCPAPRQQPAITGQQCASYVICPSAGGCWVSASFCAAPAPVQQIVTYTPLCPPPATLVCTEACQTHFCTRYLPACQYSFACQTHFCPLV
jgi:hypothetical protein